VLRDFVSETLVQITPRGLSMPDLVMQNAEATAWIDQAKAAYSGNAEFGKIASSVIWSDVKGQDGKLLVPNDPEILVADINADGYPLLIRT
jgi:hypothetical protein